MKKWLSLALMFLMMVVIVEFKDGTTRKMEDVSVYNVNPVFGDLIVTMNRMKGHHTYTFNRESLRSYEIYKK